MELGRADITAVIIALTVVLLGGVLHFIIFMNCLSDNRRSLGWFVLYHPLVIAAAACYALRLTSLPNYISILGTHTLVIASLAAITKGFLTRFKTKLSNREWFYFITTLVLGYVLICFFTFIDDDTKSLGGIYAITVAVIQMYTVKLVRKHGYHGHFGDRVCTWAITSAAVIGIGLVTYDALLGRSMDLYEFIWVIIVNTLLVDGAVVFSQLYDMITLFKTQSITDPMTGLYNRRHFIEQSNIDLHTSARLNLRCSVVICDIDKFKVINDTYGHDTGDEVIKVFAIALKHAIRKGDILARYGGEEFICFLPNTEEAGAEKLAERMRLVTSEQEVLKGLSKIKFTASFGVAVANPGEDLVPIISRSDAALYHSKQNGRNRVTTFTQMSANNLGNPPNCPSGYAI